MLGRVSRASTEGRARSAVDGVVPLDLDFGFEGMGRRELLEHTQNGWAIFGFFGVKQY